MNGSKRRKAVEMFLYDFLLLVLSVCVGVCVCKRISLMDLHIEWGLQI